MEWEVHPTVRPYHVLNPWTWLPEVRVDDIAIRVTNASGIMGHLRYMPREEVERRLELLAVERQKFSFQPFITGPYSAINIILAHMCRMPPPGEQAPLFEQGQAPAQGRQPDPEESLLPVQSLLPAQTQLPGQSVAVQSQLPVEGQLPAQELLSVQSQSPVQSQVPEQSEPLAGSPLAIQDILPVQELPPVQSALPVQQQSQQAYPQGR